MVEEKLTLKRRQEIYQMLIDKENAWDRLQAIGGEIVDLADRLVEIDEASYKNPGRQESIRKSVESICEGIIMIQDKTWEMIDNDFASAGLESPDCEAQKRYRQHQSKAKKLAKIAPPGAVVVELDEEKLECGIQRGWL